MAVKNHKKANLRLHAYRDISGDTLSRLATTVKMDMPTAGYLAKKPRLTLARIFGKSPERQAALRLKKIKRDIDHQAAPKPKRRRSRLPLVLAFLVAMLAGGGYWLYQSISLPRLPIAQYLDYQKWLDTVSGKLIPSGHARSGSSYKPEWRSEQPVKTFVQKPPHSREAVQKKMAPAKRATGGKATAAPAKRSANTERGKLQVKPRRQANSAQAQQAHLYRPLGQ